MRKKDAMKWVEALRSGKYEQGVGALYSTATDSYCCLGVLDKLFPKKFLSGVSRNQLNNYKQIGLSDEEGTLEELEVSLAALNDGFNSNEAYTNTLRLNFDEIADIIQIYYVEGL